MEEKRRSNLRMAERREILSTSYRSGKLSLQNEMRFCFPFLILAPDRGEQVLDNELLQFYHSFMEIVSEDHLLANSDYILRQRPGSVDCFSTLRI